MPSKVKVTTEDGKSVILTLDDEAAAAATSPMPSLAELSQSRPRGGFTSGEDEGVVSRTIRGMVHPSPGQQAAMDVLPIGAAIAEAAPNAAVRAAQAPSALVRGGLKVAGAAAETVDPDVMGVFSPRGAHMVRVAQRLRDALQKAPTSVSKGTGAPRVVGKAPTLTDSLQAVLEELRAESAASVETTRPVVPGAAPGGSEAADLTMRGLADRPKGPLGPTRPKLTGPEVDLTAELESPKLSPMEIARARTAERFGKTYTSEGGPGRPSVPLKEAVEQVRTAAPAAKLKLSAEEFQAATKAVQEGHAPDEVMEGLLVVRALKASPSFARLPSDAEMEADMAQRAVSGQKSLMPRFGPKPPSGNPFR